MSNTIKVGKTYRITSSRKGTFVGVVTKMDDTFIEVMIIKGRAKAILEYNERRAFEIVTVRGSLCTFTEVEVA